MCNFQFTVLSVKLLQFTESLGNIYSVICFAESVRYPFRGEPNQNGFFIRNKKWWWIFLIHTVGTYVTVLWFWIRIRIQNFKPIRIRFKKIQLKFFYIFLIENCNLFFEKPSALKTDHPALTKKKFVNFFLFLLVILVLLDPDPQHWIVISAYCRMGRCWPVTWTRSGRTRPRSTGTRRE
jgi:magnesium-transporting ATPase (P-type)